MDREDWLDIPGLDGRYQASTLGRIRSTDKPYPRMRNGIPQLVARKGKVLRPGSKKYGHLFVIINDKPANFGPLVCSAFHGPRPAGMQCAHLNGNPKDNRPENLAWLTPSENCSQRRGHGTQQGLTAEQATDVFQRRQAGEPAKTIAADYGLHRETVYKIGRGKHRGISQTL